MVTLGPPERCLVPMGLYGSSSCPCAPTWGGPSPPSSRRNQPCCCRGTGAAKACHCRIGAALLPHPMADELHVCPGWVGEGNVLPLGPAGEDGFLGDEAVPGAVGLLVHQVHPALIQLAPLEVVVGHARVVLLPVVSGWGVCGTWGDAGSPRARCSPGTCSSCR